jgi:hypothetical protein
MHKRGIILPQANECFQSEVRKYELSLQGHIHNIKKHLSRLENIYLKSHSSHVRYTMRTDSGFSEGINSPELSPPVPDSVVPHIKRGLSVDPEYDLNSPKRDYCASNASSSELDQDYRRPLRLLALGRLHYSPSFVFFAYMLQMEVAYAGFPH